MYVFYVRILITDYKDIFLAINYSL